MSNTDKKIVFGNNLQRYMDSKGITRQQLSDELNIKYTTLTDWINGNTYPRIGNITKLADYFKINISNLIEEKNELPIQARINDTIKLLSNDRQANVLNYANHQLALQTNEANSINEASARYAVPATEALAAGTGYSYGDNEVTTYYTDRDDLPPYDYASVVTGDSMEPYYHDGDVVLIVQGYDNTQGAVYAVDYNGKSYLKKVFFEGNRIRLVSYNEAYDDIYIYLPIETDETYLNIIGRVIDSFKPIN